jgi:hypothetical protein
VVVALSRLSLLEPDTPLPELDEAAAELQATGWGAWCNCCLPGEGSLLRPPRLPAVLLEQARTTPLPPWLEEISADLAALSVSSSSSS